jgi:hypothetical protein
MTASGNVVAGVLRIGDLDRTFTMRPAVQHAENPPRRYSASPRRFPARRRAIVKRCPGIA